MKENFETILSSFCATRTWRPRDDLLGSLWLDNVQCINLGDNQGMNKQSYNVFLFLDNQWMIFDTVYSINIFHMLCFILGTITFLPGALQLSKEKIVINHSCAHFQHFLSRSEHLWNIKLTCHDNNPVLLSFSFSPSFLLQPRSTLFQHFLIPCPGAELCSGYFCCCSLNDDN